MKIHFNNHLKLFLPKFFLGVGLVGLVISGYQLYADLQTKKELVEVAIIPSLTPSPTLTPILTSTPTPKPSPKPTATPKPTSLPAPPPAAEVPGVGYSSPTITTNLGSFKTNVVTLDLNSGIRVITDTANADDCLDNCPTMPLANFVSKNGGFAGINGTYFCPPDYGTCAGQINSFHQLVKNTPLNKYINLARSGDSPLPIIAFYGSTPRLYNRVVDFPKDADAAMSNYPILVQNGVNIVGDGAGLDNSLRINKTVRGFIGWKGRILYFGHVQSATIPESASVMSALGLDNALNLDGGGSQALYYNGYKTGPGRSLPNAIIFTK